MTTLVDRADGPVARAARAPTWGLLRGAPLVANPLCDLVPIASVRDLVAACTLSARNTTALLSFVRQGIGVTILPRSAVENAPDLSFVVPADPPVRRELRKIYQTERRLSPAAAALWSAL